MAAARQATRAARADGPPDLLAQQARRILATATAYFGEHGYEDTKWADVAAAVGIGSTALYHYFESKLHCLYEIMAEALESFQTRFDGSPGEHDDTATRSCASRSGYRPDRTGGPAQPAAGRRAGPGRDPAPVAREEEARELRARARATSSSPGRRSWRAAWSRALPEDDARLLTRAVLGLYNSVWHWYRPGGRWSWRGRRFFVRRQLALLSLPGKLADRKVKPVK